MALRDLIGLAIKSRDSIQQSAAKTAQVARGALEQMRAIAPQAPVVEAKPPEKPFIPVHLRGQELRAPKETDIERPDFRNKVFSDAFNRVSRIAGVEIPKPTIETALKAPEKIWGSAGEIKYKQNLTKEMQKEFVRSGMYADAAKKAGVSPWATPGVSQEAVQKNLFEQLSGEQRKGLQDKAEANLRKAGEAQRFAGAVDLAFTRSLRELGLQPTKEEEAGALELMGKKRVIGESGRAFLEGALSGATIGIYDVFKKGLEKPPTFGELMGEYEPDPFYTHNQKINDRYESFTEVAKAVSGFAGQFAGGALPYSAIAGKIRQGLQSLKGPAGAFVAKHPVFTTYIIQNAGEEMVEMGIRKGTGQTYTPTDFAIGMLFGAVFEGAGAALKKTVPGKQTAAAQVVRNSEQIVDRVDKRLIEAEKKKGKQLDREEVENVLVNTPIGDGFRMGDAIGEARMAAMTMGPRDSMMPGRMTSMKSGMHGAPTIEPTIRPQRTALETPSVKDFERYRAEAPEIEFRNKDDMKLVRSKETGEIVGVQNRRGDVKNFELDRIAKTEVAEPKTKFLEMMGGMERAPQYKAGKAGVEGVDYGRPRDVVSKYLKSFESKKKATVIDSDRFKETYQEYDPNRPELVHAKSSKDADIAWERSISNPKFKKVSIMAGGSGSGKSEARVKGFEKETDHLIYDGTFKTYNNGIKKIDEAIARGKKPVVRAVLTPIQDAYHFNQKRARTPSDKVFTDSHYGSRESLLRLAKERPDVEIEITENIKGLRPQIKSFENRNSLIKYLESRKLTKQQIEDKIKLYKEGQKFDADAYVNKKIKDREKARKIEKKGGPKHLLHELYTTAKSYLVDYTAPIEDALRRAQKEHGFEIRPEYDISYQIDRTLRAPALAGSFMEDNGLINVIKSVDKKFKNGADKLEQYLIAKQALKIEESGRKTGRDLESDKKLVEALKDDYEPYAKEVTEYGHKILDYSVESGLIGKDLAETLKTMYPDYVPLQRVFNEVERATVRKGPGSGVASASTQNVIQKLKGSEREIENPLESLMVKTNDAFAQGEKNRAARLLAGYRHLPGFEGKIKELGPNESATHTFSYLDNGVKRTFEAPAEIAEAAKRLRVEQMNMLLKILHAPTRLFKMGTTGMEPSFFLSNPVKDQLTAFINSKNSVRTSIANPKVFVSALFDSFSGKGMYPELKRQGIVGSSFDIFRDQVPDTLQKIRKTKDAKSKIAHTVMNPKEMFRALEDVVGKTEIVTRAQQYKGTYDYLIKQGRTPADAKILATQAAWQNTANFYRKGGWGNVINIIPYSNAGIQGVRAFIRGANRDPLGTAVKVASTLFLPEVMTTAWNLSDPDRAAVYNDIQDWEKEVNFIFIPPGSTKDPKTGKYNVIKIPKPPGIGNLAFPVRRATEVVMKHGDTEMKDVFLDGIRGALGSISPIDIEKPHSNLIPQLAKPLLEVYANKNFFTEAPVVPMALENVSPQQQYKEDTSGTIKLLADALGISPIQAEYVVGGYTGKLGRELTWAADKAAAQFGIIDPNQIGGIDPAEALGGRFAQAKGNREMNEMFEKAREATIERNDVNAAIKHEVDKIVINKDKQGMMDLVKELPEDKVDYAMDYFEKKITKEADPETYYRSKLSGAEAIKVYEADISEAIQKKDKQAILNIVGSLDSKSAQEDMVDYIAMQMGG